MRALSDWRPGVAALWLCTACLHPHAASQPVGNGGDRLVLTEEMITRSGALNAWEVLKRLAPQFRYSERRGQPTTLERRGRSSILLNDAPRGFLGGADVVDFRSLAPIPPRTILSVGILDADVGATYYGSHPAGGGVLRPAKDGS